MSALVATSGSMGHGVEAEVADCDPAVVRARAFHMLDLLRGICAVVVVMFHAAFVYGQPTPAEAQIVVDMFFVMSGFVIAYRYEDDLRSGMRFATFAKIRLIRLYPLFLLGTILGLMPGLVAIAAGQGNHFHWGLVKSFPLALLMLPSHFTEPSVDAIYPLNYVSWTLSLELVVNLAYAATFRVWSSRNLLIVMAAAFVGLAVCAFHYGSLIGGFDWTNAPVGPFRVLFGFVAGLLLHRLYQLRQDWPRVPLGLVLAIFFVVTWVGPGVARPLWQLFLVTLIVPTLVAASVVSQPPKVLRGVCVFSGVYSYVIYSVHAPLIGFFLRGEARLHLALNHQTVMDAVVFTLLVGLVSFAAHVAYDKPLRRFLSHRLLGPTARPPRAPALCVGAKY